VTLTVLNIGQNFFIRGGSDKYLFAVAELLQSKGHKVIPFAAAHPENLPTPWSRYFPKNVNFVKPRLFDVIRYVYSLPAAKCITRLLKDVSVDVAHLHIYYGQLTASILGRLRARGVPIVQTLHEYKLICPTYSLMSNGEICEACRGHAFWHAIQMKCNRESLSRSLLSSIESYVSRALGSASKIDHFIAVSDFQRHKFIDLGIPASKISTVHNFVDCRLIRPSKSPGEYFLYFGRMENYKGVFILLKAASAIRQIPLYIVGSGSALPAMRRWVENRDLDHIHFFGFQKGQELAKLIRESICVIVPSLWYETFGLSVVEAFAHGRPVIASRIGGITEIISDGVDGFLVPPREVEAFKEKMVFIANNPKRQREMGAAAREKVETHFSPENHYTKLLAIYRKVLQRDLASARLQRK